MWLTVSTQNKLYKNYTKTHENFTHGHHKRQNLRRFASYMLLPGALNRMHHTHHTVINTKQWNIVHKKKLYTTTCMYKFTTFYSTVYLTTHESPLRWEGTHFQRTWRKDSTHSTWNYALRYWKVLSEWRNNVMCSLIQLLTVFGIMHV